MKAVIDTNIIFSTLLKRESKIKTFILDPSNELYSCNFIFVELFKYKDRIEEISELDFDDILTLMRILFSKIRFIREKIIPPEIAKQAHELCSKIDEKDTPFIALSLFLNIPLITRDKKLINGLKEKGFEKVILLESIFTNSSDE
ncbi:MAG: PIN domain-containing protein [Candidatus Aminicenantes bacterium]|nr:MAG: PIN domain-containing protein [Candidatus Aminicenantes bacterium]